MGDANHKHTLEEQIRLVFEQERARSPEPTMRHYLSVLETFVLGPGKRLRPLFLIHFYEGCGKPVTERVYRYAVAMELLHCSTLVLDDLMDEDLLRRNAPTVVNTISTEQTLPKDTAAQHPIFLNNHTQRSFVVASILANVLYSLAIQLTVDEPYVFRQTMRLFKILNYGQILDIYDESSEEIYLLNVKQKTAIFFETVAAIGLHLGGRSDAEEHALRWGRDFGIAFQMRDDALDLLPGKMRKCGSDIYEGKYSAVILEALKDGGLETSQQDECRTFMQKGGSDEQFERILAYLRGRPTEMVQLRVTQLHDDAIAALAAVGLADKQFNVIKDVTDLLLT